MNRMILSILFLFVAQLLSAQNEKLSDNDLMLRQNKSMLISVNTKRDVKFAMLNDKHKCSKYNPLNITFSGLMYMYKKFVSPQLSADCLYSPSCSGYSKALFKDFGMVKAYFCTADRLSRCNRIAATSIHPLNIDVHDHKVHEKTDYYRLKEIPKR